jgi:UDP-N-acetylmuramate: L-alanyl-gamma-D-glutamyl-meso-diaminopimelate ligase
LAANHIHLIGICGTAMASLAGMLKAIGIEVTGSDSAAYPPMSDQLAAWGIAVAGSYDAKNLTPRPDLVVIGNAISRGNLEVEHVLDERIPFTSMAAILHDEFLRGRESLVVAGTHGKTTTTSMLAWIYEVAAKTDPQFKPSFLVGGVAENFGSSFELNATRPFILEGDEYDTAFFDKGPKFMHYFPDALILTHVEFDHADIYRDLDAVKTAFKRLVNLVPRRGRIVAFDGAPNVTECMAKAMCVVERYGFAKDSMWQMTSLEHGDGGTHWQLLRAGEPWARLALPMPGEHNALNATAAAALAAGQGVPVESIVEALASFESVKRRLEVRAVIDGITIIDDFAHHPTAIRETLRALRSAYPTSRLWAVLEPRSNTLRRNVFEHELVESLSLADRVVLAGVFKQESIPEGERLHPEAILLALANTGHEAALYAHADDIVSGIVPELAAGDVVAILSNGGFDGIYEKLPAALRAREQAAETGIQTGIETGSTPALGSERDPDHYVDRDSQRDAKRDPHSSPHTSVRAGL